jgi:hypothetical protein
VILTRASYRSVAWKNGGGVTRDILVEGAPEPLRRLSLAAIERDGPFSEYAGYDRVLVLAQGGGISLRIDGHPSVMLARPGDAAAFAGESGVVCRLAGGPVQAFNVMTRRAAVHADVAVHRIGAGTSRRLERGTWCFVVAGRLQTPAGSLHAHDTLHDGEGATTLRALRDSVVVEVVFGATGLHG